MDNVRILYIEDEPEMIELVKLILMDKGFDVIGAQGGVDGLARVRQVLPDLILLDLMMPDLDGWEVYRQIKADARTQNIPVIIITARAQSIDRVLGLQIAKVDDYVTKPFNPQDLVNSVQKALNRQASQ